MRLLFNIRSWLFGFAWSEHAVVFMLGPVQFVRVRSRVQAPAPEQNDMQKQRQARRKGFPGGGRKRGYAIPKLG